MADIGLAQEWDRVAFAPVAGDVLGLCAERAVILGHVADAAQTQAGHAAQMCRYVKEQTINRIEILRNFLNHDDMPRQARHEPRAAQHGKRHQVEGDDRMLLGGKRWFFARTIAPKPCQGAANGLLAILSPHIGQQRGVDRPADPFPIKCRQKIAGIGIAQKGLCLGIACHAFQRRFGDAAGAIPSARKPYRVDLRIVCAFKQGGQALPVAAGKMPLGEEALRVDLQFHLGKLGRNQSRDALGVFLLDRGGRCTNSDTHHAPLPIEVVIGCKAAYRSGMTDTASTPLSGSLSGGHLTAHPWFFCGIGGSGMLPLALILKGLGADVAGSDRSYDQGRTPEKFAWLESLGFTLYPQDGSGIVSADQVLVASAAVEDTVPEMVRAKALGCARMSRAQLLATLFNASGENGGFGGIAIGGTSGKSTVTGMTGWIMTEAGRDPTIMNGAVMKNFVRADAPFASARVGSGGVFVSEVDESDGSIALYRPTVAVLLNVSLDHKSMEELRQLFGDFLGRAATAVVNADDDEARALTARAGKNLITYGIAAADADLTIVPGSIIETTTAISARLRDNRDGALHAVALTVPGRHNLSNALAAIAAASAAGVPVASAVDALSRFTGLARRFDIVGTSPSGITVIDDFGHNPEKCAATLATLKAHPGRVIAFFQPHGYGPLRQMGHELAQVFARKLDGDDVTILCDPVYFGGTVDRSEGSERIVNLIEEAGGKAQYLPTREDCATRIAQIARPGDRVVVMGARDDTLTLFARDLLARLG